MKKILAWTLALALLLCGCGNSVAAAPETTAPATEAPTEATTEPTTVPTEPPIVYRNPLNGKIIDEPFTDRIFANTISNLAENMPHVGVTQADIVMEMYVNRANVIRCLALYSDVKSVAAIGSTRSTRPIFNDIAQHYSLILSHAGGSNQALEDAAFRGIENFNIDQWVVQKEGTSYRDTERKRSYENTLYAIGEGLYNYAEMQGYNMTLEKDYGLNFAEDGTPEYGEDAQTVNVHFVYEKAQKDTTMVYDAELDKYVWNQYGQEMKDLITEETEAFTNVIVMTAQITHDGLYHMADFNAGGTGYYANGGRIIPVTWYCQDEADVFHFLQENGDPLVIGEGNTYMAIVSADSEVTYTESQ